MSQPQAAAPAAPAAPAAGGNQGGVYKDKSKPATVRMSNIAAAKAVADAVRTSLGPKGMDKMIQKADGSVTITNDGATILDLIDVLHPAAKMLVQLSKAQDVEAGDGTTSVVVIAGSLLNACERLLSKGIHPSEISNAFGLAAAKSAEILEAMSTPIELSDREELIKSAKTSLNSKVVSLYADTIAPIVVDAVLKVADQEACTVDLNDIKLIQKLDGTIEDTELVDGVVIDKHFSHLMSNRDSQDNAKIALVQFCLSAPKTDLDNQVVISDYSQMDRVLKEERNYIMNLCKKIKKSGCNVLLVQKSILREAVSDQALHFLNKMKINVVKNIERDQVDFICRSLGCRPIAHIDDLTPDVMATADRVEEVSTGSTKILKGMITDILEENVVQPLLVSTSAVVFAAETVRSIMKIDDIVTVR
ncbi:chaperonin complex component TCP-1 delta subunit [Salpingoeca rosetta]|uniref:T-complex protein 1 subunit delta n=1 Tax=Salpingoeca rosetta (strain ATCC 50818 / BSB-021) TaxID=946362 RepID=F2UT17_SALR5|nr:chaperonin complex component TCP-1 delta subunit [Salpingoeca rosetta]EGD81276.1 chaperonin complex component TCP-1 delta subunit [Salpingoeca rosetta]|eukprot:XP_004987672.1 chaperonin complex component TCP-1 delta subunit [Salpingoeca rosetta]